MGSSRSDALNTEFIYYSSSVRTLAPALSRQIDRERVIPWLRKLFGPEYHAERFREKRNKYLLHLTLTLMNDGLFGIFCKTPPTGALPDVEHILEDYQFQPREWETDQTWEEIITDMADVPALRPLECMFHNKGLCPKMNQESDKLMNDMFRYHLYLLRPCAALFTSPVNKTKVTAWMQHLCRVDQTACPLMKGVRNDYIMSLYSYASDLRLSGLFQLYPELDTLIPLPQAAKRYVQKHPLTDPTSPEANAFLQDQPVPKTGAFCYITVTGDVLHASCAADPLATFKNNPDSRGPKRVETQSFQEETGNI